MSRKPNIVIFFTDDQRFDTIAALGNSHVHTPNMDRLVNEGVTFTHAHIPCGTSGAVCMPSRAMLHTGRHLFHLEGEGQSIPKEHTTLGEHLQQHGYRCFGTGKWHNGSDAYARSFNAGAEIFFGGMWDHWNVPAYDYDPTGEYPQAHRWCVEPFATNALRHVQANHVKLGKHSTELFAEAAKDFIASHDDSETPFFLYLSFMAPHDPRTMPDEFKTMVDVDSIPTPENFMPEHSFDYGIKQVRDEVLAPYPRTPELVKEHLSEYYGMINHLDHEMGKVIAALEAKGEYDNTIFVFAGDNGLALGSHGLFGKQNCYEHSIRVPLIFAGPGIPRGQKCENYAYLLDIFPTLCDLIDVPTPETVDGVNLNLDIQGGAPQRESLYFAYIDDIRAVKDERYKLIEYVYHKNNGQRFTQLFDLIEDPKELNDLANSPEHSETLQRMKQLLLDHREQWDEQQHRRGQSFWSAY